MRELKTFTDRNKKSKIISKIDKSKYCGKDMISKYVDESIRNNEKSGYLEKD